MIAISKSDLEKQIDILSRRRSTSAASWAIEEEELMDGLMNLLDKLLEGPNSYIFREEGEEEEGPSDEAYIATAREQYQRDGETEIDDGAVVSRSENPGDIYGAYVQAWVFVYESEVTGEEGGDS